MFLVLAAVDQKLWTAVERLSFVSVSVQTAECLKLQVRSGGPGEHYKCWEIQLKADVFHILGVDEVKRGRGLWKY